MKTKLFAFLPVVSAICLMLTLASCSKDSKAELSDLLSTVPAEVDMVVAVDIKSTLEEAGAKVDGGKVELTDQLKRAIASSAGKGAATFEELVSGKAGIRPTSLVVFAKGYHVWATGFIDDPAKFREYVGKKQPGVEWKEQSGVDCAGSVAISGDQFWIFDKPQVDPLEVKEFTELGDKKSFMSTEYADKMTADDYQVRGVLSTTSRFVGGDSFVKQAQMQMALQTLFSDAAYIGFTLDMDHDECTIKGEMLTSRFKPASYNLPTAKIDAKTIESLAASGDIAFAIGVDSKLVEKIQAMLSQTGAVGKLYNSIIAPIDGTVAAIMSQPEGAGRRVAAVIPTDGSNISPLTMAINGADLTWRRDGNNLIVAGAGAPSGGITAADFAKQANGALLAVMMDAKGMSASSVKGASPVKTAIIKLTREGDSVELKVELKGEGKKSNLPAALLIELLGTNL